MKIFAIDDEFLALKMIENAISEAEPDAELTTFQKVADFLEAAEKECPDVAFLDIEMRSMDGLTLAKKLKEMKEDINIIFVTGYSEYAMDAFNLYASGYTMKPVDAKSIREMLDNLRYPVTKAGAAGMGGGIAGSGIFAKTFGNFTLYKDGAPVQFRTEKGQEMVAYLIDRKGAVVSRKEIASILFENDEFSRSEQRNLSYIVSRVERDLGDAGIDDLFCRNPKGYNVDISKFDCDLYEYEKNSTEPYSGEYMEQYGWGKKVEIEKRQ